MVAPGDSEVTLVVTMQVNPWPKDGPAQRWAECRRALLEVGEEEATGVARRLHGVDESCHLRHPAV